MIKSPTISIFLLLLCSFFVSSEEIENQKVPAPVPVETRRETAAEFPLLEKVLELNLTQEPELDLPAARKSFSNLVERLKPLVESAKTPQDKIAVLNKVLLEDREVAYLSNIYWRDAFLAASLLRKKGNCLSTSTLYVVVASALKLPIRMVIIPHHAFVRWDDGEHAINIETTHKGEEVHDVDYYRQINLEAEDREKLGWGTSLNEEQFLAVLNDAIGHFRHSQNRLKEALASYREYGPKLPWSAEIELGAIRIEADLTGDRLSAMNKVVHMLKTGNLPPSLQTSALLYMADYESGLGMHERAKAVLLKAFQIAPKMMQRCVIQELAFCLRALKDYHGGARYMELALAMTEEGQEKATVLYNLAILQQHDGHLEDALESIRKARLINPERWNLQVIEAGYRFQNGQREEGLKEFAEVQTPKDDAEFFAIMQAWFYAATQQREKFYSHFEKALSASKSTSILEWIEQDKDLDPYRNDPQFRTLFESHAKRLRGH